MKQMQYLFFIFFLSLTASSFCQVKFKVKKEKTDSWKYTYSLIDEDNNVIKKLDSSKYKLFIYENSYKYFTVMGIKGKNGFYAINENEKILFRVYNVSSGNISPDVLGKIKLE